ncbi:hypothetical protein C5615_30730 [Burkholderia cepacia]|uniref:Acyltransferase 3 domain-containing protein n=1 Tax=Burkholderia cepacia TaxID=292 RepID=A0A2S8IBL8_BURCE|nr:acyltransferase [Burkholderia cepacia]PQP12184.1 hypothetical protein C5615_30730 [Burkholderia cepacia]HDR9510652.1 acyltransferase [Burkholderia cepacia]
MVALPWLVCARALLYAYAGPKYESGENMGANQKAGRIKSLDGLRGIAALSVGVFHGLLHYDIPAVQRVLEPSIFDISGANDFALKILLGIFNGHTAVVIFFVLSGFVLAESLAKMDSGKVFSLIFEFCFKRAFRIYPAVVGCMAMIAALTYLHRTSGFPFPFLDYSGILKAAALIDSTIDGPLYTLQIELCAVPFLLVAHLLRKRIGIMADILFVIYSLLALQVPALGFNFPPFCASLFAFALGGMLSSPDVRNAFEKVPGSQWIAAASAVVVTPVLLNPQMYTITLIRILSSAALVGIVAYQRNVLSVILSSRVCEFFGKISYSYYLYNVPALYLSYSIVNKFVAHPGEYALFWGCVISVTSFLIATPLSVISEKFIERWGVKFASRVCRMRRLPSAPSSAGVA